MPANEPRATATAKARAGMAAEVFMMSSHLESGFSGDAEGGGTSRWRGDAGGIGAALRMLCFAADLCAQRNGTVPVIEGGELGRGELFVE
jgi:hypothetical protein